MSGEGVAAYDLAMSMLLQEGQAPVTRVTPALPCAFVVCALSALAIVCTQNCSQDLLQLRLCGPTPLAALAPEVRRA